MKRFRFRLGTLVIVVLFLGVGLAALRESSATWDSGIFSITLGMLLISILLAIHRIEERRAFWLAFALFGSAYLGLSLVPSSESRSITTKGLAYLDSKVPRSLSGGGFVTADFDNDGSIDLYVVNNSQQAHLYHNQGNGTFTDVTSAARSNTAWFSNIFVGSSGNTRQFVRIGHSLLAIIAALCGGQLSRYLHTKNRRSTSGQARARVSIVNDSGV
jgi:hypothetical protein